MSLGVAGAVDGLPGAGGIDPTLFALTLPLVLGLVQVLKEGGLPSRWAGVAALALGIGCGLLLSLAAVVNAPPARAALTGLIAGLSAAGAWSTGKALVQPTARTAAGLRAGVDAEAEADMGAHLR